MKTLPFSLTFFPVRCLTWLLPLLPLQAATAQVSPPEVAAGQPAPGAAAAKPSFWHKLIFTGGTSLVLPLNNFKQNLDPAFSATTGIDFVVSDRFFMGNTFSYNRHAYTSSALFPGVKLESNTELLSMFQNGRFLLRAARHRLNPYVFAGLGLSLISTPTITRSNGPGSELLVTKTSEFKTLGNAGGGLDFKITPMLVLYVEAAYNTSFGSQRVEFVPMLVGFRTYPADLFRK